MKGKPYAVYKRKTNGIYYAQFKLQDGSWSIAKSTGQTAKGRAEKWAVDYLQKGNGIIIKSENITFEDFSRDFFNWNGEWATDKKSTGKRISERQCQENQRQLNNIIIPIIGEMKLSDIDRNVIKTFRNNLFKKGLSSSYINKALCNLHTILDSAYDKSLIHHVPKVEKVATRISNVKGVLSIEETKDLFSLIWPDYRAFVMNITAASTGLRRGELLALQIKNYKIDYIEVDKSYDEKMKRLNTTTKNGRTRRVIIPAMVKDALENLIELNPFKNPDSFIFFSEFPERPIHGEYVANCLYRELKKIGISDIERQNRHITFHSWRAAFNSWLINARVPLAKVMSLTGHISPQMAQDTYFRLDDLQDVKLIQESIFNTPDELNE